MDGIAFILIVGAIIVFISLFFAIVPVGLWISAFAANVRVSIFTLIGMRLRRVVPSRVINPLIKATKAGINVSINKLEAHYLAGGNVDRVVNALIAAQRAISLLNLKEPLLSTLPEEMFLKPFK